MIIGRKLRFGQRWVNPPKVGFQHKILYYSAFLAGMPECGMAFNAILC
jgi:hypothetical protein